MKYNIFKVLIDGLNKQHDDEQAQLKAQQLAQQQQQEKATQKCIAQLFADSFNLLPNSVGFTRKVDPIAIRVSKQTNQYYVEIPDTCEEHNKRTFQHHLKDALDIIFQNINDNAETEFLTTIHALSNSTTDDVSYNESCQCYYDYFDCYAYKLIKINILNISWHDNLLRISFIIDLSSVYKFAPCNIYYNVNYGFYINQPLQSNS